jgi:hypothetical protein
MGGGRGVARLPVPAAGIHIEHSRQHLQHQACAVGRCSGTYPGGV